MANIRVTCPTCESELEVDEVHDGQEVECGSCGRVFVARGRPGSASREGDKIPGPASGRRSEPRRARERDDGDDREDREEPEERPPEPRRHLPVPRPKRPPRRTRRDERDDDEPRPRDDYEEDDYAPSPERKASAGNSFAVVSLVLGILSVVMIVLTLPFACCCAFLPLPFTIPLSLAATITGGVGLRGDDDRKPLAVVGLMLGVLCLGFVVLQLAFGIIPWMNAGR